MKKKVVVIVLVCFLIATIGGLLWYVYYTRSYVSSNAVFVKSDSLTYLSFPLSGKIEKIYVKEGEKIRKGELLAKLDNKRLILQKNALEAQKKALENKIGADEIEKNKIQNDIATKINLIKVEKNKLAKNVEALTYAIAAMKVKEEKLKEDYVKFKKLYLKKKVSKEKFLNVKTAYFALREEINSQTAKLSALKLNDKSLDMKLKLTLNAMKEVNRLQKAVEAQKEDLKALNEKIAVVKKNIKDSYIYAPFDGRVAKKFASDKEVLPAGMKVLSVVNLKDLYVLDLLEETKLKGVKKGCKVRIHIDATDKDYEGVVSDILPASAATFALIPRDISSGEFTKLAQRFYVRIKFKKLPKDVLVGMSGEVEIKRMEK